jgi:glutathione synthase/RimK-type ligase-like ATP-grasp enzyme
MSILMITDPATDGHLFPVLKELGQRGREVRLFNPAAYPLEATITVESTLSGPRSAISWESQEIDLSAVGSVWYRRPGNLHLPEELSPKEAEWVRGECSALINGIYANTDALWVSEPHRLRRADLKLLQLRLAWQLGFQLPDYIVTNDPERARSFLAAHPDGVINKGLWMPMIELEDQVGMIYTHRVTAEDVEQLDAVRYGPTYLQAFIPKARDIRVTVIGDQIFPAGIDSMTVAEAQIDFRKAEMLDLPHEPVELPEKVAAACLAIVKELGLQFGAIDLLETPEGDYVFLENNPNGQWYWVEMMTGQPMAKAMVDLLERGEDERGRQRDPSRAFTPAERLPTSMPVGDQTVPLSHETQMMVLNGNAPAMLADLVATRAWVEKKKNDVMLHVGDVNAHDG